MIGAPYLKSDAVSEISGLSTTDGNFIVGDGADWVAESGATARASLGLTIGTHVQAYDAELAALAGLASVADRLPYFTGTGTASLTELSSFARTVLDDANAGTARATLGLAIGTDVQAYDAGLASLAGLTYASDSFIKVTATDTYAIRTLAETRTDLGLVIGTNVQAQGAVLDDLNTLGAAASDSQFIVATGAGAFAYESGATARTSLGLAIGTNVQAYGAVLDDLNTLGAAASDGQFIVATGAGVFAYESGATARSSIGLGTGDTAQLAGVTLTNTVTEFSTDGTLGDNSDSAVPTEKAVKTYADALSVGDTYTTRGDQSAFDFTKNDFTRDAGWHDLDLSSIVPAGTKLIRVKLRLYANNNKHVTQWRRNGYTGASVFIRCYAHQWSVATDSDYEFLIEPDSNRKIEYLAANTADWNNIDFWVRGWWT